MSSAADVAGRLEALSVAALADAMDGRGVVLGGIAPCIPVATVAGPAYTVRLGVGDNLGLHLALADAPPGSMLVALCPEPPEHGIWGAIMSTAAAHASLAGFVTNGLVRDRERLAEIGFPVFARGTCVRRAAKCDPGESGVVARLGGQAVSPGDVVCGDADGLVVIPPDELEQIVGRAEEIEANERDILRALRSGQTTLECLGLERQEEAP